MWSSQRTFWTLFLFAVCGSRVLARETCTISGGFYTYCEDGYYCCDNNTRCCSDSVLTIGAIIGIVIGGIVVLSCCGVCVLLAVKKNKHPGTVVNPGGPGQPSVTVVSATQQYPGGSVQPYGQPNGPPFGQHQSQQFGMGLPPAYGTKNPGGDPAYPPPPPTY